MDFYSFADEQAVKKESAKVIQKILSDKTYINPQKISLLISQYEKKQVRLDIQLSKAVKSQIQSINQSKDSVSEANRLMTEANEKTQQIKQIWEEKAEFHEVMEDVISLNVFENNVGKVIEQLNYFIRMEAEMNKLQKLAQDQNKYLIVNSKLLNLLSLRDALKEDASWQRETAIIRKQFVKVDNFQTAFYDKVFEKFSDVLKEAKENPNGLSICVRVIENFDKAQILKNKPPIMRDRAVETIRESVDTRFSDKLQNQDQLIGIIQHAKFATNDLVQISDLVRPCFPLDFPIVQIMQEQYQHNIQKLILPFFDKIEQDQQYGNLVALLGWIDDYETMLSRAGLDYTNLANLKSKVKILMPHFIDHNRKLVEDYIENCLREDEKNYNRKFYQEVIRQGGDLVSFFPSDIFRFINQEAQLIKDQLKGEIFVQFVRCITQSLNISQQNIVAGLLEQYQAVKMLESEEKIVDFEYKVILFINNFNQCLKHAGQSKELFSQIVAQDYKPRIEKIFMTQVQKQFNSSVPKFINVIVRIIFLNVIKESFPLLFSPKWLADKSRQIITNILKTIVSEIKDIENQNLILNLIHFRKLVQETFQYFLLAYVEQVILNISILYDSGGKNWHPKYTEQGYTRKALSQEGIDFKGVYYQKTAFNEAIKKDKQVFGKFLDQFSESTSSKTFTGKLNNKFVVLGEMFVKKKNENESLITRPTECFPDQANQLINAVMIARNESDSRTSQNNKRY